MPRPRASEISVDPTGLSNVTATDAQGAIEDLDGAVSGAAYTDEQVRDVVGATLVEGAGIDLTVNDAGNTITVASTVTQYTDEQVRDVIGTALVAGTNVTLTVNDAGDTITVDSTGGGSYTDEQARDAIGAALVEGAGIDLTVNDAGDTITVASTITQYTDEQVRDVIGTALVAGTDIDVTVNDAGDTITIGSTASAAGSAVGTYGFDLNVFVPSRTSGTWSITAGSNYWGGNALYAASPANGQYVEYYAALGAGTWKVSLMYARATDRGILNLTVNGTSIGSIDAYGTVSEKLVYTTSSFVLTAAADYLLRIAVNGKNASSSNYYAILQRLFFERTA